MPETAAMIENTLTLPDGRVLGYGIYGDPAGFPVFDFHGIPGSRREAALIADYIGRDDVCFIGMDRPGYGRSSPKRNFRIVDFPGDVVALADQLKIAKFAVLGYSGGGPFALACAAQIPGRLASLAVVSGVGPADIGPPGHARIQPEEIQPGAAFALAGPADVVAGVFDAAPPTRAACASIENNLAANAGARPAGSGTGSALRGWHSRYYAGCAD